MVGDRWERIHELFAELSRHGPEARLELLDKLCPDDAGLRAEVLSLLEHNDRAASSFLTPPSLEAPEHDPLDLLVGRKVDRYSIIRQVAKGGMGPSMRPSKSTRRERWR